MKKALFLTHVGAPGGAEFVMTRLCAPLKDYAHILHFQHGPLEGLLKEKGIAASVLDMPPAMKGFKREDGIPALLRAVPATLSMVRALARKCRDFDTIVCMSQKSFILAALAKPFMRKPIIWFMNDLISPEHFSRPLIVLLTKIFARSADHIVLNSQASMDAWVLHGGRRKDVHVIYPGTDVAYFAAQIKDTDAIKAYRQKFARDGKPLIGIFGRLTPWKGQNIFLQAIAKLPDVNAVIVGDALFGEEDYRDSLEKLVKDLGLENCVTFAGHVEDVPKLMAACDVIAHCSTAAEPFGLVIVEAMLSGAPVIASDGGGAREIVIPEETGLRTAIGDADALAQAIQKYIDKPEWTAKIAKQAKQSAAEKFSNDAMIKQFQDLLQKL